MSQSHKTDVGGILKDLEKFLETYLVKKAPALPDNAKEIIVKIAPWLVIIGLVLAIPAILSLIFGITNFGMVMSMHGGMYLGRASWLLQITTIATMVLQALSIPGLFKRTLQGWEYMFYASLVGLISNIFFFTVGSLLFMILGFYLLFQVKNKYH